jgi:hypothetical protein
MRERLYIVVSSSYPKLSNTAMLVYFLEAQ